MNRADIKELHYITAIANVTSIVRYGPNEPFEEMNHKAEKCAEVLVPERVDARFVVGAYVANQTARLAFQDLTTGLPVRIRSDMFF